MKDPDWQEEIEKVAEEIEASGGDQTVIASALPRLWQRIGGMKASEADWQAVTTIALTAAQFTFAPAVKHYGPFCLHPVVITYKDGREETQSYYQVVLGTHPTPFIIPMDAYGVAGRGQEIAAFTILGQVPIAQSELQDVVKHLKLRLLIWNASGNRHMPNSPPNVSNAFETLRNDTASLPKGYANSKRNTRPNFRYWQPTLLPTKQHKRCMICSYDSAVSTV